MNDKVADAARAAAIAGELRTLMSRLRRRMRDVGADGLTESQLQVLSRLDHHGPATVTVLAKDAGMRPQSMGATIAVLETRALVKRSPDPTDGRQTILSLTPASRRFIKSFREARNDWLFRAIRTRLSIKEQETMVKGVELLKRLIDDDDD
jgi:DNA-binding MarR family transcriptional regulator